jgi:multidrug resistance efflux pump
MHRRASLVAGKTGKDNRTGPGTGEPRRRQVTMASSRSALKRRAQSDFADAAPAGHEPSASPSASSTAGADAPTLQALLRKEFPPVEDAGTPADAVAEARPAPRRVRVPGGSRIVKTLVGLALLVVAGWMPVERLFQVASVEAVVNAPLVTLRAPIAGVVESGGAILGTTTRLSSPLLAVVDPRADRRAFEDATRRVDDALDERDAAIARLAGVRRMKAELETGFAAFRQDRLVRLDARIEAAEARLGAARAGYVHAAGIAARNRALHARGVVNDAALDESARASAVARAGLSVAGADLRALHAERKSVEEGRFFAEGYNDEPRTAERIDELRMSEAALEAEIARGEARVLRAEAAFAREQAALELASRAEIAAPLQGRVWEVLTAPGEQVAAGQPLVRILDCARPVVTAAVSEAVYNGLSLGMEASFTFREGGAPLPGRVVGLSGIATAPANLAILPSALVKESYRVAVEIDGGPGSASCEVGRTGRVVFGQSR